MTDDALEQALTEEPVAAMQSQPFVAIPPEMPISEAIGKLAGMHVACLLVEDEGKLVGVFSDRDVLDRIALEYDQMKDQPVSTVMTTAPVYVYDTDSSAAALAVMAVSGFRHVPVVNLDEQLVGIVSPQRVTAFLQEHMGN